MKQKEREKRRLKKRRGWIFLSAFVFSCYIALAFLVTPIYTPQFQEVAVERQTIAFNWPAQGTASVGSFESTNILTSNKGSAPIPSASTIKLLTALVVLEQKPLGPTEQGEAIYFGSQDTERFNETVAKGGAAIAVAQDTTITYREALDAMLMISANNIAEKLAIWGFGSVQAYTETATLYAKKLGLSATVVTDASGLLSTTTTSANDMVLIAKAAIASPTIASIVKQTTVTLVNGTVLQNTNNLLSEKGVIGLKTGFTGEAGYCLVLAKTVRIFGRDKVLFATTFGQPNRISAETAASGLISQVELGYENVVVASKNQKVAELVSPWGAVIEIRPKADVTTVKWKGDSVTATVDIASISQAKGGDIVGQLKIDGQTFDLVTTASLPRPSIWWRITHAVDYITQKL